MRLGSLLILLILLAAATVSCSRSIAVGNGLLPEGIEKAQVPVAELGGYVFASSDSPLGLPVAYFRPREESIADGVSNAPRLQMNNATIVIGSSPESFAGTLEFASNRDAEMAWTLFQDMIQRRPGWGKLSSPRMFVAVGTGPWLDSVRQALDAGQLALLRDHDPVGWSLITNLPQHPPSRPSAAGVLRLEGGLLESLGKKAGIVLDDTGNAFGFLRVDTLGFGVYTDTPTEVPRRVDLEFLKQSGAGVLFVSRSSYPGFLVSFMLSRVAGRTGMQVIDLGNTNARYRTVDGLHLIIKNKSSLVYAALAAQRSNAERLMLSAISD